MIRLNAFAVFAALAMLTSCAPEQVRQGLKVASDANLVDQCAEFLEVERDLRARLRELPTPDLVRLAEIDIDGTALCTLEISDLTAELRAMLGRLP